MVEQCPLKAMVGGSSPPGITITFLIVRISSRKLTVLPMERKGFSRLAVAVGFSAIVGLSHVSAEDCEANLDLRNWDRSDLSELRHGYCQSGIFIPGLPTYETWMEPAPIHNEGNAVWYNPEVMQEVAGNKGIVLSTMDPSSPILDGVAVMSPADVGKTVWIFRNEAWEGPYLAIDTTNRQHMFRSIDHVEETIEISFETANRWGWIVRNEDGSIDRLNSKKIEEVEICIGPDPSVCADTEPVDYPTWWRDMARFENPSGGRSLSYSEVWDLHASAQENSSN